MRSFKPQGQFGPQTAFLDRLESDCGIPACDCMITRDGETVYRHMAGYADVKRCRPVSENNTYWVYSATKLFACVCAMQLIERGCMNLDDLVSRYLPEYEHLIVCAPGDYGTCPQPSKNVLTIRHLMTMTAGLDYNLDRPGLRTLLDGSPVTGTNEKPSHAAASADPSLTTRRIAAALTEDPLCFEPGIHFLYGLCHDALGAVIEIVFGQKLNDYVQKQITMPLGMTGTTFQPSSSQIARLSVQYAHTELRGGHRIASQTNRFRLSEAYDSGGAGLMTTVNDYIRLSTAVSLGGTSPDGYVLLRPETVSLFTAPQLSRAARIDFVTHSPAARNYNYALGVQVLTDDSGTTAPAGTFGWDGTAGACTLIDSKQHIALFYAQQVLQASLTIQHLYPHLRDLAFFCLEDWR